ncbi:MAG TPA: hypothetical protein VGK30_15450 [Candidatus Binatia bacterium]
MLGAGTAPAAPGPEEFALAAVGQALVRLEVLHLCWVDFDNGSVRRAQEVARYNVIHRSEQRVLAARRLQDRRDRVLALLPTPPGVDPGPVVMPMMSARQSKKVAESFRRYPRLLWEGLWSRSQTQVAMVGDDALSECVNPGCGCRGGEKNQQVESAAPVAVEEQGVESSGAQLGVPGDHGLKVGAREIGVVVMLIEIPPAPPRCVLAARGMQANQVAALAVVVPGQQVERHGPALRPHAPVLAVRTPGIPAVHHGGVSPAGELIGVGAPCKPGGVRRAR